MDKPDVKQLPQRLQDLSPTDISIQADLVGEEEFTGNEAQRLHKKASLNAIIQANGYLRIAYHKFGGAHPSTITNWANRDPIFAKCLDEINEFKLDLAEMSLEQRMHYSDTLLMYFLNNKGQGRGYMPPAMRGTQNIKHEIVVTAPVPKPKPE